VAASGVIGACDSRTNVALASLQAGKQQTYFVGSCVLVGTEVASSSWESKRALLLGGCLRVLSSLRSIRRLRERIQLTHSTDEELFGSNNELPEGPA
jgi:hypothetical protein